MPKKPYADTRLAKFMVKRVMELRPRKSQAEISTESGVVSLNMLSMFKNGASKLPLDRVPSLARALECDPAYLLRLTLEQLAGDTAARALEEIWARRSPATSLAGCKRSARHQITAIRA